MTTATYNETPTQQSNLPPAIQRQVTEANNLIKQLNAKPGEIPAGTVVQEMPGNDVPGASPSATAQPSTAPAAQPAPPNPADTVAPDSAAWEQRYRTLQGKYDAETRATREILAAQQRTMDALISRDHSSVAPTPPAPEQTNEEFLRELGVTPKEIEDYGELLPIVAKMARNMIKPTASKLEAELNKTRQAAGTVAAGVPPSIWRRSASTAYGLVGGASGPGASNAVESISTHSGRGPRRRNAVPRRSVMSAMSAP